VYAASGPSSIYVANAAGDAWVEVPFGAEAPDNPNGWTHVYINTNIGNVAVPEDLGPTVL
jgi:hypothetical protein